MVFALLFPAPGFAQVPDEPQRTEILKSVEVLDVSRAQIRNLSYDPQGFWLKGTDVVREFSVRDAGELFKKFFISMHENFIEPISYQDLFTHSIAALSTRLPPEKRLRVDLNGSRLMLYDHNFRVLGNFPAIAHDDPERWANMLVNIIINLRKTHEEFADLHAEQIYYLVLGGLIVWADRGGEYRSAFDTRNRALVRNTATLGATYRLTSEGLQILSLLHEGPLFYAGLGEGDLIITINGRDVRRMSLENLEASFFGESKDMAAFQYISYTTGLPGEATVRKAKVISPRVVAEAFSGFPGITVYNFGDGAAAQMKAAIDSLQGEGLVLDLRAAQGGSVAEALEAANLFLDKQDMLRIAMRDGSKRTYTSKQTDHWKGKPIVLLVDGSTRGTGEVFALALSGRAAFLGTPTSGDGFYRTVFALNREREVEFATGEVFSMRGKSLAQVGVAPAACVSSLIDEVSVKRFVQSLADGSFKDTRNIPDRATKEEAERIRTSCPATYPGPEREKLFEMAAAALLSNPAAYKKLLSYD